MTATQAKTAQVANPASPATSGGAPNELDQIMNEIEQLQHEMTAVEAKAQTVSTSATAAARAATPPASAKPSVSETVSAGSASSADANVQEDSLSDFHKDRTEDGPSLEETLGSLKEEEPAAGSLLSQAVSGESDSTDEVEQESTEGEGADAEGEEAFSEEELEALEQIEQEATAAAEREEEEQGESTDASSDEPTSEVDDLNEELEEIVRQTPSSKRSSVTPIRKRSPVSDSPSFLESSPSASGSEEGTLSMTLSGKMRLKLRYDFHGQEVEISFDDDALRVRMAGGAEFRLPIGKKAA
jgi:hypothetical protein